MDISWWTTDSLQKLFPETQKPAGASTGIELWAARNETEDAQVGIAVGEKQRISGASFAFSDLKGPRNHTIPKRFLRGYWQWFVYVHANPPKNTDPATYLRGAPAFFPDAFLEEEKIAIRGRTTQPLWVCVRVPADAAPGTYTGRLSVRLEGRDGRAHAFHVPIVLHVWPFTLPQRPSLHHTEWLMPEVVAGYYHVEPWSERHWSWMARIAADMARHRQDMILTRFTELVDVIDRGKGPLAFDFTRLDRWLDLFEAAGVEWIEGGHVARRTGNWESPFAFQRNWAPLDAFGKRLDTSPEAMSDARFRRYVEALLKAVHAHLRKRGAAARYVQHVADEPIPANRDSWCRVADTVRKWLPGVRRIDAIVGDELRGHCEIQVPQIQHVTGPSRLRSPEELWCYTCLAPQGIYPNRFLDYASIRNRIIFWLCWTLKLKGFLHWGYAYWSTWGGVPVRIPISPWTDATGASLYCADTQPLPAGDPHIVYPGRHSICSSIRWEVVRKGMEDVELLVLLEKAVRRPKRARPAARGKGRDLLAFVKDRIAPTPAAHTHDDALLLRIRREIGDTVARLCPEG
ncbi:MAG: DUF4091 domain-containing protein [Kiritimatiellae bacterium]|nr:DUF4091 domain-containing protein [Kiritimatiellia bacterium]